MTHRFLKNGRRTIYFTVSFILVFHVCRSRAQDFFAGARGGASFDVDGGRFRQMEAYGGVDLPWRWYFHRDWYLRPGGDISAGCLWEGNTSAFVGSMGPFFELGKGQFPVRIKGGFAPTILSGFRFPTKDFGDDLQFTTRIGLEWEVARRFSVGAWFSHMSNGSISRSNPGLNLETLSLQYNF
ncbi:MAG TPA: acyloxyacyl hydrolase [Candidatus Sulfotelmatobacter sp.]|nr:acyloxyacyl hydrolase [Candidatus Sulfotelmatobacter sp.]